MRGCVHGEGVEVVCVWGVDVFGVSIGCAFPPGEDEDGGAGGVGRGGVGACDYVFHGATHAFVVIFWVGDGDTILGVRGVTTAGREDDVVGIE
jgi:hypothetical protein